MTAQGLYKQRRVHVGADDRDIFEPNVKFAVQYHLGDLEVTEDDRHVGISQHVSRCRAVELEAEIQIDINVVDPDVAIGIAIVAADIDWRDDGVPIQLLQLNRIQCVEQHQIVLVAADVFQQPERIDTRRDGDVRQLVDDTHIARGHLVLLRRGCVVGGCGIQKTPRSLHRRRFLHRCGCRCCHSLLLELHLTHQDGELRRVTPHEHVVAEGGNTGACLGPLMETEVVELALKA
ncbi:hypothetical protein F442_15592 [Phytophthora nicotianae P10297]|uniref:Uncharacterized protein n=1 Tax=Phytophthora nicotianae P10297 TaxID=1317064 RepID=W2YQN5_PHYNI|nr:hypothetical protein F442_15592 [Phytophthora nicotianae P10297]